jgi:very-short-patch-repair endonuclease
MRCGVVKDCYFKEKTMSDFQNGFDGWGVTKRNLPWTDILRKIILEIGDRPDLTETEYHKMVAGKLMARLPSTKRLVESIARTQDVKFGLMAVEKWFQTSGKEMPAPDTVARQTRTVKAGLIKEKKLTRDNGNVDNTSFDELMVKVEEKTANVYPGLEPRFLAALRKRFPNCHWEENKTLQMQRGPFAGQTRMPDIVCERLQLAIEIDSLEWHSDRTSFTTDRQKVRALQHLGYYVLSFSGPELTIVAGIDTALDEIQFFINHHQINSFKYKMQG